MAAWEESDKVDWITIKKDLDNPNSGLSLVLQNLFLLQEKYKQKAFKARNEDSIHKFVGIMEGLDLAIRRANEIVEFGKQAFAEKQEGALA